MVQKHEARQTFKERVINRKNAAIAAAGLAIYGAGLITHAELSTSDTTSTISALDKQREATQSEALEVKALQTARDYEQTLNGGEAIKNAQVLAGEIEDNIDGKWIVSYKNAFILARVGNATPDNNGAFLKGAWLGVSSNDSRGDMIVTAVPFDASTERYVASGSGDQILPDTEVQGIPLKGGQNFSVDAPVVFDVQTHNNYRTPEGEIVVAGLGVGGN